MKAKRTDNFPALGEIVQERYQVTRRLGAGAFGAIFEVQDLKNGQLIALKYEKSAAVTIQLKNEHNVYVLLDAPVGIPRAYEYWLEDENRIMGMDRLGVSLGTYFRKAPTKLSLKSTLMIGIQMVSRLEYMHQRSYIHRDIKPDNFVFGVGTNSNLLYLIDFGLSQRYRDMRTFIHKEFKENQGLVGTTRYVSINVHLGVEQSCRDDLESIAYVLIYLALGCLPWQNLEDDGEITTEQIKQSKMDVTVEQLCADLPHEFSTFLNRIKSLRYDERPPYSYLRSLLINVMVKEKFPFDYGYDWVIARRERLAKALDGQNDNEIIIDVPDYEIEAGLSNTGQMAAFFQPLPFFSITFEASIFVGRSRATSGIAPAEQVAKHSWEEQTMFLFNQDNTKLPANPIECEFEPCD